MQWRTISLHDDDTNACYCVACRERIGDLFSLVRHCPPALALPAPALPAAPCPCAWPWHSHRAVPWAVTVPRHCCHCQWQPLTGFSLTGTVADTWLRQTQLYSGFSQVTGCYCACCSIVCIHVCMCNFVIRLQYRLFLTILGLGRRWRMFLLFCLVGLIGRSLQVNVPMSAVSMTMPWWVSRAI